MWDSVLVRSDRNGLAARPPGRAASVAGALLLGLLPAPPAHAENEKPGPGPGIRANAPWLSFYGSARQMGDLDAVAATFRLINIDADPDTGNFSPAPDSRTEGGRTQHRHQLPQYRLLRADPPVLEARAGRARCPAPRTGPPRSGPYRGFPDEVWMNPSNPEYQRLILEHVAPRLAATGVDGFFLDNLEIVEHGASGAGTGAPCDRACVTGTLALVARLRRAFPGLVLVMQNATSATTREAVVGGVPFPRILDGVSHEEVYAPRYDRAAESELLAWAAAASRRRRPLVDHHARLRRQLPRSAARGAGLFAQPRQGIFALRDDLQRQPGQGL